MLVAALAVVILLALRIWAHDDIVAVFQAPYGEWVYHGLGFLLYASIALFIDRVIRYFYWRGYLARKRKRPTPALIEDIVSICLVVIALSIALSYEAGMDVAAIITAGGATAIVVGIALQTVIQDVFSGLSINLDGSYAIGDWLTVYSDHFDKPQYGRVTGITWRSTYLRTWDGRLLMIPNHMATSNAVTNHCSPPGPKRMSFLFPIDYRVPATRAHAVLMGEAFKTVRRNALLSRSPEPSVTIREITSDATIFEVRFYADPDKVEPEVAITIVATACQIAINLVEIPTPVTQVELTQIPDHEILEGRSEGRAALKLVPLFAAVLSEKQFQSLNEDCRLRDFKPGQAFITQGDSATSMYVLLEGAAVVTVANARGEDQEVAVLSTGDFVGEMSLMTGAPRTASVTPLTPLRVLEITKEAMEELLRDSPELLEHFSRVMAQRQFELQDMASRKADIETAQVDLLTRMTAFFARVFRS